MNPNKFGKLDNHDREPWKMPLGRYGEHLYHKRFGRDRPETVVSIEERRSSGRNGRARRPVAKREFPMADRDLEPLRSTDRSRAEARLDALDTLFP